MNYDRMVLVKIRTSKDGKRCHRQCPYLGEGAMEWHCYLRAEDDDVIVSHRHGKVIPGLRTTRCVAAEEATGHQDRKEEEA